MIEIFRRLKIGGQLSALVNRFRYMSMAECYLWVLWSTALVVDSRPNTCRRRCL